jgi:hypothetical protein
VASVCTNCAAEQRTAPDHQRQEQQQKQQQQQATHRTNVRGMPELAPVAGKVKDGKEEA